MSKPFDFVSPIDQAVANFFNEFRNKYNKKEQLIVAIMVSGGLDSVALASKVIDLKKHLNVLPYLVYVDFKDFKEHEITKAFVVSFAEQYSVPLMIYNPKTYNETKTSARDAMKSAGMSVEADVILTGHHADDQVETFLFRAFRGSGVDGLGVMKDISEFTDPETKKVRIFGKPFLPLFKEDISDWTFNILPHIKDSSNNENGPERNYIRNEILPKVTTRFNKRNILNTIAAINDYLEVETNKTVSYSLNYTEGVWSINSLLSVPVLNRVFLIRRHLSTKYGHNLNRKSVKGLKEVMCSDWTELRHYLTDTIVLLRDGDCIKIIEKVS